MTVSVVFAIAGVMALLFGIIGGGVKVKEIEVPMLPMRVRIFTIIIGVALIGFTIWQEYDKNKSAQPVTAEPTPEKSSVPKQTTTPFDVDARTSTWVDTEILLQRSDEITIQASGAIDLGGAQSGPDGNPDIQPLGLGIIPSALYGTLVGMIGSGDPFVIGSYYQAIAQSDGILKLVIIDALNGYTDNSGQFHLNISITKGN